MNMITKVWQENDVRIVVDERNEPWWVAKDVCDALELTQASKAIGTLDADEKGRKKIPTLGGEQEMATINEPGLYTLIMRSNKPKAKAFRRWVTHDVLPSIRATGGYKLPRTLPEALRALADTTERLETSETEQKRLEAQNEKLNPLAQLYHDLMSSEGLMDWKAAAKALHNRGYQVGRQRLIEACRKHGFIIQDSTEPYQQYIEQGLFCVKLLTYTRGDREYSRTKTFVTPKGIDRLDKMLRSGDKEVSIDEIDLTEYIQDATMNIDTLLEGLDEL